MLRIGIKNINYISENFPKLESPNILEIYSTSIFPIDKFYLIKSFIESIKPKIIQIHINNLFQINNLFLKIDFKCELWIELEKDNFLELNEKLKKIKNHNISIILNIKIINVLENLKLELNLLKKYCKEIYIVDTNLYKQLDKPNKLFKLREKLILTENKIIKFCKLNQEYYVFDFKLNNFNSCIDLNKSFRTLSEIKIFQNKNIPDKQCKYFCNKIIYDFEEKLKRKLK